MDIEPIGAYRFEPDGVQFEVPLRATIELEDGQGAVLAQLTSSDGSTEFLSPVTRTIRPNGRTTLVYEIDHFTDFRVYLSVGGSPRKSCSCRPGHDRSTSSASRLPCVSASTPGTARTS